MKKHPLKPPFEVLCILNELVLPRTTTTRQSVCGNSQLHLPKAAPTATLSHPGETEREADATFTSMLSLLFMDFTYKLSIPRKHSMNNSAQAS